MRRLIFLDLHRLSCFISIHAPARGATIGRGTTTRAFEISIHASARGATDDTATIAMVDSFQSTLPHGERHIRCHPRKIPIHFNPRSRTGSDITMLLTSLCPCPISIHAPARGATAGHEHLQGYYHISIHAPARGATGGVYE